MIKTITPSWPAQKNITAFTTTRAGGVSKPPFDTFNLAAHVGDDIDDVKENRKLLKETFGLPYDPVWLTQTHSNKVINSNEAKQITEADGSYTNTPNTICAILTADCLPILLCNKQGTEVAALHGGWRGLKNGIIEQGIKHFQSQPSEIMAWLGSAIGPDVFEVGGEVREQFIEINPQFDIAFKPLGYKYLADIYKIATIQLNNLGINQVYCENHCTYSDNQFFSYRRSAETGRIASLIYIS